MPPSTDLGLPFITRNQLDFNHGTVFQLQARIIADATDPVYIVGATKAGMFKFRLAATSTFSAANVTFGLPDLPIWVSVVDADSNYGQGGVYARIALSINGNIMGTLCSGYLTFVSPISWPMTSTRQSGPDVASRTNGLAADPAAGAQATFTFSNNTVNQIKAITVRLVTDGTAANRTMNIIANDGTINHFHAVSGTLQTASQTIDYNCYPTQPGNALSGNGDLVIGIPPDTLIHGAGTIKTAVDNMQAADQISVLRVSYRRYFSL